MNGDSVGVERRRLPFAAVDKPVIEDEMLSAVDVMTYMALVYFADNNSRECWPSLAKLARIARCHPSTVSTALGRLEASGYIKREERRREDGGRGSNLYTLAPLTCQRFIPTVQGEGGLRQEQSPPTVQGEGNYTHSEQDSNKKRETRTPLSARLTSEPTVSLSPIIAKIKTEAETRGAPPSFICGAWSAGILELQRSGVGENELLEAFGACIEEAPERVTFFPRDFLKWRKISQTRKAGAKKDSQVKEERQSRERDRAGELEHLLREREDPYWQGQVAAALAQLPWRRVQAKMSEKLDVTAMEFPAEFCGVRGDGLGEGEIICEADLEGELGASMCDSAKRESVNGRC
jgi:hypothetical protein